MTTSESPIVSNTSAAPLLASDVKIPLTDKDRCDSCGARAYARAEFLISTGPMNESGTSSLLFCGHHFHRFQAKLNELARNVVDDTHLLLPPARTASGGFV